MQSYVRMPRINVRLCSVRLVDDPQDILPVATNLHLAEAVDGGELLHGARFQPGKLQQRGIAEDGEGGCVGFVRKRTTQFAQAFEERGLLRRGRYLTGDRLLR